MKNKERYKEAMNPKSDLHKSIKKTLKELEDWSVMVAKVAIKELTDQEIKDIIEGKPLKPRT